MKKIQKHIEIVRTTQPRLSSMGQESSDLLEALLKKHYTKVGVTIIDTLSDLDSLVLLKPDLVFLTVKFIPVNSELGMDDPEGVWVSTFLEEHSITYTGSGQQAHELELNKDLAKQQVAEAGLRTAKFSIAVRGEPVDQESLELQLRLPIFIKPTNRGGGSGIDHKSVAQTWKQVRSKINSIVREQDSDALLEEYLPGREFSVAILRSEGLNRFSTMPIELVAPSDSNGLKMLSDKVKSSNAEEASMISNDFLKSRVNTLALEAFHALGGKDYGRIDIRLDRFGNPNFLEANLIPSLLDGYGSFPKACMLNMQMEYEEMILSIVNLALEPQLVA